MSKTIRDAETEAHVQTSRVICIFLYVEIYYKMKWRSLEKLKSSFYFMSH